MNTARKDGFVPLFSGASTAPDRAEMRVTVVKQPENLQSFQPLGKPQGSPATHSPGAQCEPRVSLQREGDRVSGIRIQCTCGQVIELACVYQAS